MTTQPLQTQVTRGPVWLTQARGVLNILHRQPRSTHCTLFSKKSLCLPLVTVLSMLASTPMLIAGEQETAFRAELTRAFATSEKAAFALVQFPPNVNAKKPGLLNQRIVSAIQRNRKRPISKVTFFDPKPEQSKPILREIYEITYTQPVVKRAKVEFEDGPPLVARPRTEGWLIPHCDPRHHPRREAVK